MNLKNIDKSRYKKTYSVQPNDIFFVVRKNGTQTPYLIYKDKNKMLKLINLQSGASNYCADTIDSLVGIYIKENQESPANKVNPIKEYFFAKSHETSIHVHNTFNYNPIK
ncbi:hypothetical protein QM004_12320 [Bacillus subtilis]|uniref:hypothetical protein n=1 Tax=Bacillus subtilis TaxID=1423 RepID=UPI001363858F|nr:hypothetical protein [Bacillus subtilis]QHJ97874.1 hypothetical protein C7M17_00955 [Bacillus subtilis]WIY63883.1 hypothetical protein QM004_12320 [Bacillus subtilis]